VHELHVTFAGRGYSFVPGRTVAIGRSTDSDIVVADPTVSRQHARLTWGADGWVLQSLGRSGTYVQGLPVTRMLVTEAVRLRLASPEGPVVEVRPAAGLAAPGLAVPGPAAPGPAAPGPAAPGPAAPGPPVPDPALPPGQPPPGQPVPGQPAADLPGPPAPVPAVPRTGGAHRGGPAGAQDEIATAFSILVPVRSWLTDPGWRRGTRLLVIPYALLPLVFLALFGASGNLSTPGWAYSLYIAPLWAIAFWLLIRPGPVGKLEGLIGAGIVAWVLAWMSIVTISINNHLSPSSLGGAVAVGFNEEITKALPVLVAALLLLRLRRVKLDVRMWMFLGTIAGLTFGVREASLYTTQAIEHIAAGGAVHSANVAVVGALSFAYRVFVDGFQHAIWAGVSAFFVGIAVNYPRRRVQLIAFGILIAALLHALNDWLVTNIPSLWPWIFLQAVSLVLFLGYTMSAASIERNVRRTPLFRGDSILLEKFTDSGELRR
jgi:RsiW-degrading membrane proteinase PrsW (M82 family)